MSAPDHLGDVAVRAGDAVTGRDGDRTAGVTLVFAGDTSLGDWYLRRQGGEPLERLHTDPLSFVRGVGDLVADKDLFVLNFESVLAHRPTSPWKGQKKYLGWDDPERTVSVLQALRVDAAGLANNHTMDFGPQVLTDTLARLREGGIRPFGAGATLTEAAAPLTWTATVGGATVRVHVLAGQATSRTLHGFGFFATDTGPGVRPLSLEQVTEQIRTIRSEDPDALIVLFPHWGRNYEWASERMRRYAREYLAAGADVIIGHGAHMATDLAVHPEGTAVFSLGNFVFNSRGRYAALNASPYSVIARLQLAPDGDLWRAQLRLYPIVSDNTVTGYRPRPVEEAEAREFYQVLRRRAPHPTAFAAQFGLARDPRGWCLVQRSTLSPRFAPPESSRPSWTGRLVVPVRRLGRPVKRVVRVAVQALRRPVAAVSAGRPSGEPVPNRYLHRPSRYLKLGELESHVLECEALRHGLTVRRFNRRMFVAYDTDGNAVEFSGPASPATSGVAIHLTGDKSRTRLLLAAAGLPIARGRVFPLEDGEGALAFAEEIGWPVVIKPVDGSGGKGVFPGLRNPEEFTRAYTTLVEAAPQYGWQPRFLVEEHIDGEDFRFFVLNGEVLSVIRRRPASVVGDGVSTVAELIERKNAQRTGNPHLRTRPLRLGPKTEFELRRQGLTLDSVPKRGQTVLVSRAANLSQGGESIEVYDEMHPSLREIAGRAATAIPGLGPVGVDLIVADHRLPADRQRVAVCEVNGLPGSTANEYPMYGRRRRVIPAVFQDAVRRRGVTLGPPVPKRSTYQAVLDVVGVADPAAYRDWFTRHAAQLRLGVSVSPVADDHLRFLLSGRFEEVVAAATRSVRGPDGFPRPLYVEVRAATEERPEPCVPQRHGVEVPA